MTLPSGKAVYECAVRGWKVREFAAAAGIGYATAARALKGLPVSVETVLAISLAFARTRDQIRPEVVALLNDDGPTEAA